MAAADNIMFQFGFSQIGTVCVEQIFLSLGVMLLKQQ
jgi:hypothetical protein